MNNLLCSSLKITGREIEMYVKHVFLHIIRCTNKSTFVTEYLHKKLDNVKNKIKCLILSNTHDFTNARGSFETKDFF